ncbi:hypothetical protein [uncultured Methanospirillum sp.]|uniref:hypothetical protein n=1 Tax=uncultured Methanospirillum sp. TaxID=262503 RepID=UPI0029C73CEE|nr:hypothetical protein [uncultured Methanospirillum sp.]
MRRVCAFCNEELSPDSGDDDRISHGVCTSCYNHIKASMGVDITEYLTMLDQPVVLVDQDLHILSANQEIRKVTRKDLSSVIGHLSGEVFECEYARCPGGCGNTTHCSGCVIRNSVKETYQTGRPVDKRPATIAQDVDGRPASVSLLISTVKTGDVVLLQVEESSEDCTSGCSDKS